jgi:hypothetical protein
LIEHASILDLFAFDPRSGTDCLVSRFPLPPYCDFLEYGLGNKQLSGNLTQDLQLPGPANERIGPESETIVIGVD